MYGRRSNFYGGYQAAARPRQRMPQFSNGPNRCRGCGKFTSAKSKPTAFINYKRNKFTY